MLKLEFIQCLNEIERRHGCPITWDVDVLDKDYEIIEYVYTWHPAISDTTGKREIAALYYIAGMDFIRLMLNVAQKAEALRAELEKLRWEKRKVESEYDAIKSEYSNLKLERVWKTTIDSEGTE